MQGTVEQILDVTVSVAQRDVPAIQTVQNTTEVSQLQFINKGRQFHSFQILTDVVDHFQPDLVYALACLCCI